MIVLWILLGLLAAVFLLLLVPVHADVRYREKLELDVRYLFLRRTLLPAPEEPQAEKAEAPSKEKKPEAQKQKKNPMLEKLARFKEAEGLSGLLHLAGDFLRLTGTSAAKIIRCLKIRDFDLYVLTGDEDAAAAAILYGQACAVVYPAPARVGRPRLYSENTGRAARGGRFDPAAFRAFLRPAISDRAAPDLSKIQRSPERGEAERVKL